MSRRSRFSMINPTDGPRVGAWRRAALGFCLAAALSATGVTAAQAATLEGQQFDDTVVLGQHKLQLNGLGLRGVAWLKAFVAGLYVTTPSRDAAALLAETGPRRLRLKIMLQAPSNELTKSLLRRVKRHETPEVQARLADRLALFAQQLDGLGQLMPGDVVDMDYLPGKGLVLSRNGKAAGKPVVGDDLYRAVLQIFVGEHAIDPRMKQGLLGAPA
ncbi:MAG: hypothetical protein E6Q30_04220 [Aquabacterium sp.]|jgi:hypothetical protein|nr:MAG: hypothetical protein E6Q30_04220 [Aquabacterium sp.]